MTSYIVVSVCFGPISGEIGPPPIMLIYISSGPDFHRDFESEVRKSIFCPWHLMWPYLCFSHISINWTSTRSRWSVYHLDQIFYRDSESEVRNSKFHPWHLIWPYLCFGMFGGNSTFTKLRRSIHNPGADVHRDSESKVRSSKFHPLNPQVHDSILLGGVGHCFAWHGTHPKMTIIIHILFWIGILIHREQFRFMCFWSKWVWRYPLLWSLAETANTSS